MVTVGEAVEKYVGPRAKRKGLKIGSIRSARYILEPFAKWCDKRGLMIDQLTPTHLEDYLESRTTLKANSSLKTHGKKIQSLLNFAVDREWRSKNINMQGAGLIQKVRKGDLNQPIISHDQIIEAMDNCSRFQREKTGVRNEAIVGMFSDTGMRSDELIRLDWSDLDWDPGMIHIREGSKTGEPRDIPLSKSTLKLLRKYWNTRHVKSITMSEGKVTEEADEEPSGPLFSNWAGGKLHQRTISKMFQRLSQFCEFPITSHMFRRRFITDAADAGVNPAVLAQMTGHKSLDELLVYYQPQTEALAQAHKQFSPMRKVKKT